MNKMEKAVLDIIEKRYNCRYNGRISVVKVGQGWEGYRLTLGEPYEDPIQINADLEADDFLKFVEQELISRHLHSNDYYRIQLIEPENEERRTCQQN